MLLFYRETVAFVSIRTMNVLIFPDLYLGVTYYQAIKSCSGEYFFGHQTNTRNRYAVSYAQIQYFHI